MGEKLKHRHWYAYIQGNPLTAESYYLIDKKPVTSNGKTICAIYARGFVEQPEEFSSELKLMIARAIATGQLQTTNSGVPIVLLK